jgi:hypothetical protein
MADHGLVTLAAVDAWATPPGGRILRDADLSAPERDHIPIAVSTSKGCTP